MESNKKIINELELDIARKIKKEVAKEKGFLPIKICNNILIVLTKSFQKTLVEELEFIFSRKVELEICDEKTLNSIIEIAFCGESKNLEEEIILKGINLKSSDIHIEPREKDVVIRYRIDGTLCVLKKIMKNEYQPLISKIKVKASMDIAEKRRPQDGKYFFEFNEKKFDLRVATIPTFYGEKVVIRLLYGLVFNYTLENLNFSKTQIDKLSYIISRKNGLVIVNGPTGSGKSTTLYAILQKINNDEINITTLEDPIEVIIPGVNQMSLNRKANIDFATGLKGILRQDPDVIMLGEIRDEETASMAIRAALTGHKVYSTIHAETPRDVYLRLEDIGVKPYLIRDSLVGIISQRLIRVLCDKCKKSNGVINHNNKRFKSYESFGCLECNNSGYKGRKMISSVNNIKFKSKTERSNIFQEINGMDNAEMVIGLQQLLINGEISINDYRDFIIMEGGEVKDNDEMAVEK